MRGGVRQRCVTRDKVPVWCPNGRWGGRRVRVSECSRVFRSEDLYTALLRQNPAMKAGESGRVSYPVTGSSFWVDWELRSNAVWRFGRAFFRCGQCCW